MNNCKKCGAVLPSSCENCLICNTKAGEAPQDTDMLEYVVSPLRNGSGLARHSKKLKIFCMSLGLLLLLSAVSLWLYDMLPYYLGVSGKSRAKNAIVYVTEDRTLKFKSPSIDFPETVITNFTPRAQNEKALSNMAKTGPNGRYLAYVDIVGDTVRDNKSAGKLYVRDFAQRPTIQKINSKEEFTDILICENATDKFFFNENGSMMVFIDSDDNLSATDFTQNWQLDEGVTEIVKYKNGKLLYAKSSHENSKDMRSNMYVVTVANGSEPAVQIDSGIITLASYTDTLDRFVYLAEADKDTNEIRALDVKQGNRQILAVGVDKLISADADTFTALYQTKAANPLHYDSIINDELARDDDKLAEPDLEKYPILKSFFSENGETADYKQKVEDEEIIEEGTAYEAEIKKFIEKLDRDDVRIEILREIDAFVEQHPFLFDLYLSQNGNSARLAEGSYSPFDDAQLDAENAMSVWSATNFNSFEKIQFANVKSTDKISDELNEKLSDHIYFEKFGYTTVTLSVGNSNFFSLGWQLTKKADGIYFAIGEGTPLAEKNRSASLYFAPIIGGSIGSILLVDDKVDGIGDMLQGNKLLYYKDKTADTCDLYAMTGTTGERIGEDVTLLSDYFKIRHDGNTLLFCERFVPREKFGNLFMIAKQNRQLATDVCGIYYRNDSLVYFLRNVKDGKPDLYSFGGDGLSLIDKSIVAVMED